MHQHHYIPGLLHLVMTIGYRSVPVIFRLMLPVDGVQAGSILGDTVKAGKSGASGIIASPVMEQPSLSVTVRL